MRRSKRDERKAERHQMALREVGLTDEEISDVAALARRVYEEISADISQIEDWDDEPESWAEVVLDARRMESMLAEDASGLHGRSPEASDASGLTKFRTLDYKDQCEFVIRRVI